MQRMSNDEPRPEGPLSWRDVYRAVGDLKDDLTAALARIEGKFDGVINDHEARLRALEAHGSPEAQEALKMANENRARLDTLTSLVSAQTERRVGFISALSAGQKVILLAVSILSGTAIILDLLAHISS